jgi:hypothetical protein
MRSGRRPSDAEGLEAIRRHADCSVRYYAIAFLHEDRDKDWMSATWLS